MAVSRAMRRVGEDVREEVPITDFSRGHMPDIDPNDAPLNGAAVCENLKPRRGSAAQRFGWIEHGTVVSGAGTNADGIGFFKDSNNANKLVVWHGGNLYDISSGIPTTVASAIYTSTNRIAWAPMNNKLYWSDGTTITTDGPNQSGCRIYDGSADSMLVGSGNPGTISPPAAKVMSAYAGSLVLGNCKLVGGTLEPHIIRPTTVNDPTDFLTSLAQNVAPGVGGEINSIVPFSLSTDALQERALFIGKSESAVFGMQGALGSFVEHLVNIKAGVLDGHTAAFVPGPGGGTGVVVFVGTDKRVYATDGTGAIDLGKLKCGNEIQSYIEDRQGIHAETEFRAAYDAGENHYVLDCGGSRQYCYYAPLENWTRYQGWPSGLYVAGQDGLKRSVLYCVYTDSSSGDVVVARLNAGPDDNGTQFTPKWKTPDLKGAIGEGFSNQGQPQVRKIWGPLYLGFKTDTGTVSATLTTNQDEGPTATTSVTISASSGSEARYDMGGVTYDDGSVYAGSLTISYDSYYRCLQVLKTNTDLPPDRLMGGTCAIEVSQTDDGKYFELQEIRIELLPRGKKGGAKNA